MVLRIGILIFAMFFLLLLRAVEAYKDEEQDEQDDYHVREINFVDDLGAIPENTTLAAKAINRELLSNALNGLEEGNCFVVPNQTFHTLGGIVVETELKNVKIVLAGTLKFDRHRELWPRDEDGNILDALQFQGLESVTLTSTSGLSDRGTLNGQGRYWWDLTNINDNRPKLLSILNARDVTLEKWAFIDSPFWSCSIFGADGLTVRHCDAITTVARYRPDSHGLLYRFFHWICIWFVTRFRFSTFLSRLPAYSAINTDGFDFQGSNVHGHDLYMATGDDAIAVKGSSSHMLFERLRVESGLGLAIGSVTTDTVQNITFRDAVVLNSMKGIYVKTNWHDGAAGEGASISDILYENITIVEALQFSIWIGPAAQLGNEDTCSLRWPQFRDSQCIMAPAHSLRNITLRSVVVVDPYFSPGVLLGNQSNPMTQLRFQNVNVVSWRSGNGQVDPSLRPWGLTFYCTGVSESYAEDSHPSPACFSTDSDVAQYASMALGGLVVSLAVVTLL